MFDLYFVIFSSFAIITLRKRAGCFALIMYLLSCGCYCSVSLPHGVMGLSVVCDCGISWSYFLVILTFFKLLLSSWNLMQLSTIFNQTTVLCVHTFTSIIFLKKNISE